MSRLTVSVCDFNSRFNATERLHCAFSAVASWFHMVQLKVLCQCVATTHCLISIPKGPIKNGEDLGEGAIRNLFQFYEVRLKAAGRANQQGRKTKFQFHKVRLKTPKMVQIHAKIYILQFQWVRLIADGTNKRYRRQYDVSIPKGSIKLPRDLKDVVWFAKFQFQKVRLKATATLKPWPSVCNFNSIRFD